MASPDAKVPVRTPIDPGPLDPTIHLVKTGKRVASSAPMVNFGDPPGGDGENEPPEPR
jgi:hypothetical protein